MNAREAYIQYTPGLIDDDGVVTDTNVRDFLANYVAQLHASITRVYTALPRSA